MRSSLFVSGDDQDTLDRARRWRVWRAGMHKAVKRQHIKRARRELARLMLT
jgi:RNase P protein component